MLDLLCALVTWRISSLLVTESGPYDIFAKIRYALGVRFDLYSNCGGSGLASVLCCVWCASIWVSAFVAVLLGLYRHDDLFIVAVDTFAFSAGAILVESVVHHGSQ